MRSFSRGPRSACIIAETSVFDCWSSSSNSRSDCVFQCYVSSRSQAVLGNAASPKLRFAQRGRLRGNGAHSRPPAEEAEGTSGGWWEGEPDAPSTRSAASPDGHSQAQLGNEGGSRGGRALSPRVAPQCWRLAVIPLVGR